MLKWQYNAKELCNNLSKKEIYHEYVDIAHFKMHQIDSSDHGL